MLSVTPPLHLHRNSTLFFFPSLPIRTRPPSPSGPFRISRCSSGVQEVHESSSNERDQLGSELYASAPLPAVKAAKRVVLVRHGQSTWNEEGRIQGSSNFSVLTKKGEAQAQTSRQMLIDDAFDVCFTRSASALSRCAYDSKFFSFIMCCHDHLMLKKQLHC